ncbi:MAG TPA: Rieske (2Fe-2S) protein [Solirubrobacterales bacterium]
MTAGNGGGAGPTVDVGPAAELEPGQMVPAQLGDLPVVVIRDGEGELHAYVDRCLHQGARLSDGRMVPCVDGAVVGDYREVEGPALKCPWHGYEYDVKTGCVSFDPRRRLRKVAVAETDGRIVIARRKEDLPAAAPTGAAG